MRPIILSLLASLICLTPAHAQQAIVRITSLLLTQERAGWRASFPDGTPEKYTLGAGDLITRIDHRSASKVGPLALTSIFNAAFTRTVPLTVERGPRLLETTLWRGDGSAPPTAPATQTVAVSFANRAPGFALPSLTGATETLSNQKGHWVLLSFWATWCAPCMQEAPVLNTLAREYPNKLTVLALAVSDTRNKLEAFVKKNKPAYIVVDAGSLQSGTALAYGVGRPGGGGSVPVNVLIRPNGMIAYVQSGYEAPSPLERQVSSLLSGER